ncbi:flagellar hook-length control protein FliK [Ruegeria sp. HKCCD8929]|uniref:flagellar hook-length control protein FliK n=1 Tax=Ruegeria sp. HKCCD8929 TaxID=2683006 RepID=UPI0014885594
MEESKGKSSGKDSFDRFMDAPEDERPDLQAREVATDSPDVEGDTSPDTVRGPTELAKEPAPDALFLNVPANAREITRARVASGADDSAKGTKRADPQLAPNISAPPAAQAHPGATSSSENAQFSNGKVHPELDSASGKFVLTGPMGGKGNEVHSSSTDLSGTVKMHDKTAFAADAGATTQNVAALRMTTRSGAGHTRPEAQLATGSSVRGSLAESTARSESAVVEPIGPLSPKAGQAAETSSHSASVQPVRPQVSSGPAAPSPAVVPDQEQRTSTAASLAEDLWLETADPGETSGILGSSQANSADRAPLAQLPSTRAELARAVAGQLSAAVSARAGAGVVDITLNPEELGRVSMALSTRDDALILSISSERPETLDLMRRHIAELSTEFRELGYESVAFEFGTATGDTENAPQNPEGEATKSGHDPGDQQPSPNAPQRIGGPGVDLRL